jgi:hypothetical protein
MVTRRDYTAEVVEAAKSVLIELTHLLGEYRDSIVLIGGWVPELLIPQEPRPHVGSMDIDLALNHVNIREEGYKLIEELLTSRGYYQEDDQQPFIFFRDVPLGDSIIKVQVATPSRRNSGPIFPTAWCRRDSQKWPSTFPLSRRSRRGLLPILKRRMIRKKWNESPVTPTSGSMPS